MLQLRVSTALPSVTTNDAINTYIVDPPALTTLPQVVAQLFTFYCLCVTRGSMASCKVNGIEVRDLDTAGNPTTNYQQTAFPTVEYGAIRTAINTGGLSITLPTMTAFGVLMTGTPPTVKGTSTQVNWSTGLVGRRNGRTYLPYTTQGSVDTNSGGLLNIQQTNIGQNLNWCFYVPAGTTQFGMVGLNPAIKVKALSGTGHFLAPAPTYIVSSNLARLRTRLR